MIMPQSVKSLLLYEAKECVFSLISFYGHFKDFIWYDLFIICFARAKIEKEKKKVAQEAGFIRAEVTGGEVRAGNWLNLT